MSEQSTTFQRENQRVSSSDLLQAIAAGRNIKLTGCTISGEIDINRLFASDEGFDTAKLAVTNRGDKRIVTLDNSIEMTRCRFEDDVFFAPPWDRPETLSVVFRKQVVFNSSTFAGQSRFSSAVFEGLAGFDGCKLEHVCCFRNVRFCGQALFRTVMFNGYGLFNAAVFEQEAYFNNTCFSKGGNFTKVKFKGKTDFSGVYSRSRSVPVYESVTFDRYQHGDDETFWRFIKQASQEAGYYQLAGESFYNERCAHFWRKLCGIGYDELSSTRKLLRLCWGGVRLLPEFVFGRLLFGYGERPTRVLIAGVLIILACAFFYCSDYGAVSYQTASETMTEFGFMDGLYFSTITFTTLGFGDMCPDREDLLTRCVTMFEALSGACLMALFVVCLSKRFSRG